jgi:hypothetical protein
MRPSARAFLLERASRTSFRVRLITLSRDALARARNASEFYALQSRWVTRRTRALLTRAGARPPPSLCRRLSSAPLLLRLFKFFLQTCLYRMYRLEALLETQLNAQFSPIVWSMKASSDFSQPLRHRCLIRLSQLCTCNRAHPLRLLRRPYSYWYSDSAPLINFSIECVRLRFQRPVVRAVVRSMDPWHHHRNSAGPVYACPGSGYGRPIHGERMNGQRNSGQLLMCAWVTSCQIFQDLPAAIHPSSFTPLIPEESPAIPRALPIRALGLKSAGAVADENQYAVVAEPSGWTHWSFSIHFRFLGKKAIVRCDVVEDSPRLTQLLGLPCCRVSSWRYLSTMLGIDISSTASGHSLCYLNDKSSVHQVSHDYFEVEIPELGSTRYILLHAIVVCYFLGVSITKLQSWFVLYMPPSSRLRLSQRYSEDGRETDGQSLIY